MEFEKVLHETAFLVFPIALKLIIPKWLIQIHWHHKDSQSENLPHPWKRSLSWEWEHDTREFHTNE